MEVLEYYTKGVVIRAAIVSSIIRGVVGFCASIVGLAKNQLTQPNPRAMQDSWNIAASCIYHGHM